MISRRKMLGWSLTGAAVAALPLPALAAPASVSTVDLRGSIDARDHGVAPDGGDVSSRKLMALIEQAARGNTAGAARAMVEEQRVRLDPDARADRFVEGWQAMQRQRVGLERAGDTAGAERLQARMEKAAGGLARDPQLESALRRRAPELEIRIERERSIGDALARSISHRRCARRDPR